jgi:glycine/D-amino acid oxidase-like deaminating enzyme
MSDPTGDAEDGPCVEEPARRTRVQARTDVLVVGGGAAGVAAAVAAARNGATTMLVERAGALGGLATGGLIILLLTLDDGAGRQVVGGLCQEVVDRIAARGGAYFPRREDWGSSDPALVERDRRWGLVWGSAPHRVRYSVAYDPEEMRFALSGLCEEARVRLLFHCLGCEGLRDGDRLRGVAFQGKSGRFAVLADVVIDATGDGDVFASVGEPFELERVLPWLWLRMGGVADVEGALDQGGAFFRTIGDGQVLLPWGATERIVAKIDATDPEDLTRAELECRRNVMAAVDELRRSRPEFAGAHVCEIARDLGITESRRLVGRVVLGREDLDRRRADAIALTGHWTRYGALYWIPYGSLLAPGLENLLVAGRCISVDHRTHHATKEIPPCMATGQAAGTAAAMAVRAGIAPARLDVAELRARLLSQGAILDVA